MPQRVSTPRVTGPRRVYGISTPRMTGPRHVYRNHAACDRTTPRIWYIHAAYDRATPRMAGPRHVRQDHATYMVYHAMYGRTTTRMTGPRHVHGIPRSVCRLTQWSEARNHGEADSCCEAAIHAARRQFIIYIDLPFGHRLPQPLISQGMKSDRKGLHPL